MGWGDGGILREVWGFGKGWERGGAQRWTVLDRVGPRRTLKWTLE